MRIVLELGNIPYTVIEERMRDWTDTIADLPNPCVPIVNIDGVLMRESNDINVFLDREYCDGKFSHPHDKKWFTWCDEFLKPAVDHYKYGDANTRVFTQEAVDAGEIILRDQLQVLEDVLLPQQYLCSDVLSLSDIAIIPFIRQVMRTRNGSFDFTDFPQVEKWTNSVIQTDWFENDVMKKYPFAKEKV